MAIYAQIQNGFVMNVILLDDPSILNLFYVNPSNGTNYDFVVQIDQLNPVPQIGWSYAPGVYPSPAVFTNPNPPDQGS